MGTLKRPRYFRAAFRIGLSFLYRRMVNADTSAPFKRFIGTTHISTSPVTPSIDGFIAVPMAMMESSGMPYSSENFGSRYTALKSDPNTVITSVPMTVPMTACFLFFFAR